MYRELIEKYLKENPYIKIADGASEKQIEDAEKTVGIAFPKELKELLREMNGDRWLIFSTEELIKTNQGAKEAFSGVYDGIEDHLFLAGNGCGDYYCYEISDGRADENALYMWCHEDNETKKAAGSLAELIEKYYNSEI